MLKKNFPDGMAVITVLILICSVAIMTLQQQQTYALRNSRALGQLRTLTSHLVKDVSKLLLPPHSIAPFVKLTNQFEKNVIKAIYAGNIPPNTIIPNLVQDYGNAVIALHPPDSVVPLLETYKLSVLNIFNPP